MASPHINKLFAECNEWIDADSPFESQSARSMHKQHRLSDLAARGFPWLALEEQRPVARYSAFFAILDDYMDHSSQDEVAEVEKRVSILLTGEYDKEPGPGFYHQVYMIRKDALSCQMPMHLYQQFIDCITALVKGYGDEKHYNAANIPATFEIFESGRCQTAGGLPYSKYLCMQKNYRCLPEGVLSHPNILRLQRLANILIGYHNDFVSLPKELARKGDVMNLVMTVQHEFGLSLTEAYFKALQIHDASLAEFIRLQNRLPDFGEQWQSIAQEYATDLGIMLQGVYSWHTKNCGRYIPSAYVEPELETICFVVYIWKGHEKLGWGMEFRLDWLSLWNRILMVLWGALIQSESMFCLD